MRNALSQLIEQTYGPLPKPATALPKLMLLNAPCNCLALVRPGERYCFVYDDEPESEAALLRLLGRYAADPDLSFNWMDAAVLSQKIRGNA